MVTSQVICEQVFQVIIQTMSIGVINIAIIISSNDKEHLGLLVDIPDVYDDRAERL